MYLSSHEKREMINFIAQNTTYDMNLFMSGKTDAQINAIYKRIKEAIETYPKEIYEYLQAHKEATPRYTLEQLLNMKYNELSEIRRNLKIKKKGKKVVKQEQVPLKTVESAHGILDSASVKDVALSVIRSNALASRQIEHEEILTEEEIIEMYGESMSAEQLAKLGIILDKVPFDSEVEIEEKKYQVINDLLEADIVISGKTLSFSELLMLSEEEIYSLHEIVQTIKKSRTDLKRLVK